MKSVQILHIQSEYGKIQTNEYFVFGQFSSSANLQFYFLNQFLRVIDKEKTLDL